MDMPIFKLNQGSLEKVDVDYLKSWWRQNLSIERTYDFATCSTMFYTTPKVLFGIEKFVLHQPDKNTKTYNIFGDLYVSTKLVVSVRIIDEMEVNDDFVCKLFINEIWKELLSKVLPYSSDSCDDYTPEKLYLLELFTKSLIIPDSKIGHGIYTINNGEIKEINKKSISSYVNVDDDLMYALREQCFIE